MTTYGVGYPPVGFLRFEREKKLRKNLQQKAKSGNRWNPVFNLIQKIFFALKLNSMCPKSLSTELIRQALGSLLSQCLETSFSAFAWRLPERSFESYIASGMPFFFGFCQRSFN